MNAQIETSGDGGRTSRWAEALRRVSVAVAVLVSGITADQLLKSWALQNLADGQTYEILPFLSLSLAFNPGAAFGIGAEAGAWFAIGILVILLALSGWIIFKLGRGDTMPSIVMLSVVAAGGWGNMLDRITRADGGPLSGDVVDYFAAEGFAIFNLADVFAVVGMTLWGITTVLSIRNETSPPPRD